MKNGTVAGKCVGIILSVLLLNFNTSNASVLSNNIALASLGATAEDNGNWYERSNPGYGFQYDANLAIDDNAVGSSFWAGIGNLPTEQIWVIFNQRYNISSVYLDELTPGQAAPSSSDYAYLTSGKLEYLYDNAWHDLTTITKATWDYTTTFPEVAADGIRLTVYDAVVPSGWVNHATCLYSLEVGGVAASSTNPVPTPSALLLFASALIGIASFRRRKS